MVVEGRRGGEGIEQKGKEEKKLMDKIAEGRDGKGGGGVSRVDKWPWRETWGGEHMGRGVQHFGVSATLEEKELSWATHEIYCNT